MFKYYLYTTCMPRIECKIGYSHICVYVCVCNITYPYNSDVLIKPDSFKNETDLERKLYIFKEFRGQVTRMISRLACGAKRSDSRPMPDV